MKISDMSHKKAMFLIMSGLLLLSMIVLAKEVAVYTESGAIMEKAERDVVVIDAGHGAADSGKVGIDGSLEKDINLEIALKLQMFLEKADVEVIMTRVDDQGLYPKTGENKKVQDMKNRIELINDTMADLTVSVHQNSYTEESVEGVQVFYYTGSEEGQEAAVIMQEQLIHTLQPDKERVAKDNNTYYLLKETINPIVIVECGFLSNRKEAELLNDPLYQEKVAWGIHLGILQWLNQKE